MSSLVTDKCLNNPSNLTNDLLILQSLVKKRSVELSWQLSIHTHHSILQLSTTHPSDRTLLTLRLSAPRRYLPALAVANVPLRFSVFYIST